MDGGKAVAAFSVACALLAPGLSAATGLTGYQLADMCRKVDYVTAPGTSPSGTEFQEASGCIYYITGFADGQDILYQLGQGKMTFCIPNGVKVGQMVKITMKHLDGAPEHLHLPAKAHMQSAFMAAFPCKK